MTVTTERTVAALRRGADLIEQHGWTQGHYYRSPNGETFDHLEEWEPGCAMCALGALRVAGGNRSPLFYAALLALSRDIEALPDLVLYEGVEIPDWNDAPDTTADQVVAQMRKTADRLEKEAVS